MKPLSRGVRWCAAAVLTCCICVNSESSILQAQAIYFDRLTLDLLRARSTFRAFERDRQVNAQHKELERLKVPGYNQDLSKAVFAFHSHIADMHQRHIDCKVCRQLVSRIRHLAKRIDQAMK